ncbi:hypothetical protein [Dyadobacter sp. CY326]|uniref:hypothetical protein n=1 Tax=Dyadobacter sp. CY326 TaxID=2907300 RepID=UPI001F359D6A|nr:hypothetical protein [Dyadobacter sp. CY326]MCE7066940.1 hypothetical protein [Dyadobacter sp. CY326]
MKNLIKRIALLGISCTLFNCSNTEEIQPGSGSGAAQQVQLSADGQTQEAAAGLNGLIPVNQTAWRVAKTLTLEQGKGFNLISPFAITSEFGGDISWGSYGCYAALKPVKVSFHNLKIVDVSSITPLYLKTLPFNQTPIANAPEGSASWVNYMPAKTIVACKTANGKYYLVEVLSDNPLKVNIYHPFRI